MKAEDKQNLEGNPGDVDPDVQLMLAFKHGNEEAFVALYRRHRDRVVNFTRRLMGNMADGEEAAQEVFLKLYHARASYQARSRFLTYLFRIAFNHCLNLKARHGNKLRAPDNAALDAAASPPSREPEALTQQSELRAALQKALASLPEKQAAAVVLCHFEGMSCQSAADVLEVSEGAVKQLLHRARQTLAERLLPDHPEVAHAVR